MRRSSPRTTRVRVTLACDDLGCLTIWPPSVSPSLQEARTTRQSNRAASFRTERSDDPESRSCSARDSGFDASHRPGMTEDGLLRGSCHRARTRATRWLAATLLTEDELVPASLRDRRSHEAFGIFEELPHGPEMVRALDGGRLKSIFRQPQQGRIGIGHQHR